MSKKEADYKNTVIYKIVCKDPCITDTYVGHTTNFLSRMNGHKASWKKSNFKLYKTIRENGGWDNWQMFEIEKCPCDNIHQAKQREQHHYNLLNSTLNSVPPHVEYNVNINNENGCFNCKECNFNSVRKSQYVRHIKTEKHIRLTNENNIQPVKKEYKCECGNIYKHRPSLHSHKLICNDKKQTNKNLVNSIQYDTNYVLLQLIKQNSDSLKLQSKIIDVINENNNLIKDLLHKINNSS